MTTQGTLPANSRDARRSGTGGSKPDDSREPFQRDRDRILYSDYFRRLAGVTQVASAGEGTVFHNRLTHSLKVAQVARRLAERILRSHPHLGSQLSADVVEAAALAHDLGHPPFGHVAEKALCSLAEQFGLRDGFEGNAQTFRILVRLAVHKGRNYGLDLARATLAATLKYPWRRSETDEPGKKPNPRKKFCVYDDDVEAFEFAKAGIADESQSLEAQVMDHADSITYSVHDLEDFFRAGLIPLERILKNPIYRVEFLRRWKKADPTSKSVEYAQNAENFLAIDGLLSFCIRDTQAEQGTQLEAEMLDGFRSAAITQFLKGISVVESDSAPPRIELDEDLSHQCSFFHRLVRDYVIDNPRLATQQAGQVRIVTFLASFYKSKLVDEKYDAIPTRFRQKAELARQKDDPAAVARMAIDIVASLSEAEATMLFRRVTGHNAGSLLDLVH